MILWTLILSILIGCCGIYQYFWRRRNFFERLGIPHEKPWPVFGNLTSYIFRKRSYPDLMKKIYYLNREAKYVGFFEFTEPIIILRDPEIIKSVMIRNFDHFTDRVPLAEKDQDSFLGKDLFSLKGIEWHESRCLLSPVFTSSKIKEMFTSVSKYATNFAAYLATQKPEILEMRKMLQKYNCDVTASFTFGVTVDSVKNPSNEFFTSCLKVINIPRIHFKSLLQRHFPFLSKVFDMQLIDKKFVTFLMKIIQTSMSTRIEKRFTRPDLIQLLMNAKGSLKTKLNITIEYITIQAFIFFLPGFTTSANMLSWMIYEIALNSEVQRRLQREIDEVMNETNEPPNFERINKLPFLDSVIRESMRLHPSTIHLRRKCTKEFTLPPTLPGKSPLTVKPGMVLWVSPYTIHTDPKYYEDPEKFKPERFFETDKIFSNSPKYLPFGIGPRNCMAYRFALMKIKTLLFYFFAKCDVDVCSKTCIPIKLMKGVQNLLLENGFWLSVKARERKKV